MFSSSATPSVYERIGGEPSVDAAVDIFYDKVLADKRINYMFEETDMSELKAHQKRFLTVAMGGPNEYTGKNMREAHKFVNGGEHPTEEHFGAVAENLVGTL